jgi:flavin-binding protein dodecin
MSKPYKQLLGNRVYLKLEIITSSLEMAESAKKAMVLEAAKKLNKAVVYDIGHSVVQDADIKYAVGDRVMVSMQGVTRGEILNLDKDTTVVMVSPLDIIHIW